MGKALIVGFAATLLSASVGSARAQSLGGAVRATESASSYRYSIVISVVRQGIPDRLTVHGVSGRGQLFVRVRQARGPEAAAMIDGPFLYERAPPGLAVNRMVRWLRVPIGRASAVLDAVRAMTPAPLFRVLGESHAGPAGAGTFAGRVDYDDPIVRSAITRLSGGIEFREVRVTAQIGGDGLISGIGVTGTTADGTTTLDIKARLYAFGRPVQLTPPAEGTFVDQQLLHLAE